MPVVAEVVDAVIGGDTHRDTHALEMTAPTGATIATLMIANDDAGFAAALAWIADHAPGPRLVVGLEGTRSYGIGLVRAVQGAGLVVVEVERPRRPDRRRGKSDPIDAHLAALHVLRLDADRLPTPRADGDREALRILLGARRELTTTRTKQINRLRALLLTGEEADRRLSRGTFSDTRLTAICRRRSRLDETVEQAVRRAEARRLAIAIREAGKELQQNKKQLAILVDGLAPQLRLRIGVGPVSAAQAIVSWSHHGAVGTTPPSPHSPARARSRPAAAASSGIATTAAATAA